MMKVNKVIKEAAGFEDLTAMGGLALGDIVWPKIDRHSIMEKTKDTKRNSQDIQT